MKFEFNIKNKPNIYYAKVIRIIRSCNKFNQLSMAYECIVNYRKIFPDCYIGNLTAWDEYNLKCRELKPKE